MPIDDPEIERLIRDWQSIGDEKLNQRLSGSARAGELDQLIGEMDVGDRAAERAGPGDPSSAQLRAAPPRTEAVRPSERAVSSAWLRLAAACLVVVFCTVAAVLLRGDPEERSSVVTNAEADAGQRGAADAGQSRSDTNRESTKEDDPPGNTRVKPDPPVGPGDSTSGNITDPPVADPPGGGDGLDDTPDQLYPTGGCPDFPVTDICTPDFPGIMFMNYMDYSDSDCKNMFTNDQAALMNWYIDSVRYTLLDPPVIIVDPPNPSEIFKINIYPNPTSDKLVVEAGTISLTDRTYTFFDSAGRLILKKELEATTNKKDEFDVSDFAAGVYLLRIKFEDDVVVKKFVKL